MYQTVSSVAALLLACILQVAGVVEYEGTHRGLAVFQYQELEVGAFQFGGYIYTFTTLERTLDHEYGHYIQEQNLGPWYLIIGLLSWGNGIRRAVDDEFTRRDYLDSPTEAWATVLGGH